MQEMDYAVPYLKNMLSFLGMADITVVRVEGTSIPGVQDNALQKGIDSVQIN
jgi:FMN-dependent NADH-azoreductase